MEPAAAAEQGLFVVAATPLRCLLAGGLLTFRLTLQLDESGRISGLEAAPAAPTCSADPAPAAWAHARPTVVAKLPKEAPQLASTAALRFDPDAVEGEEVFAPSPAEAAAQKPPQTLMQKYGFVLVALGAQLLLRTLTAAEPPATGKGKPKAQ